MLCYKIEINELERFMQTIEIEILKSDCFTQTRASIHILELFSEIYIQKKNIQRIVLHRFTQNLEISYSC